MSPVSSCRVFAKKPMFEVIESSRDLEHRLPHESHSRRNATSSNSPPWAPILGRHAGSPRFGPAKGDPRDGHPMESTLQAVAGKQPLGIAEKGFTALRQAGR